MSYILTDKMLDIDCNNNSLNRLLGFLARFASDDGSGVWPSNRTLVRLMGASLRSVQGWMKTLRRSGIILEVHSHHRTREYRFNLRLVDMLRGGGVSFDEMVRGRVVVEDDAQADAQLVLPGMRVDAERRGGGVFAPSEGDGASCAGGAQSVAPANASVCTQIDKDNTTPRACARALDLRDKCLEAAGDAMEHDNRSSLDDVSEIEKWLENGADLDRDILPIIAVRARQKAAVNGMIYSWAYYTHAVLAATARRTAPVDLSQYRRRDAAVAGAEGEMDEASAYVARRAAQKAEEQAVFERNRRFVIERFIRTGMWESEFGAIPADEELAQVRSEMERKAA